jgi:serpin B
MTSAGADGATREEMARVLHLPTDDDALHDSFKALRQQLQEISKRSAERALEKREVGGQTGAREPIILATASRLFAQKGYEFRKSFLVLTQERCGAPLQSLDFVSDAGGATQRVNGWISDQTHGRIRDLIPIGELNANTRFVLANAIHFRAQWDKLFLDWAPESLPFHIRGGEAVSVPTMQTLSRVCGYAKRAGFTVVTIPYIDRDLQFLILFPDDAKGLPALETQITATLLVERAKIAERSLLLHLPKFKFEPATLKLASTLQGLGMKTAFDLPRGSANFDRMATRKPNDYLYISEVFHKTFIAVDENGTEAAAAASTEGEWLGMEETLDPSQAIEVKIDRPFFYAIQHVPSGTCLFIGRVTDPR